MIKKLLYIVNLLVALLLAGVYAGEYLSPESFPKLSLLSYIYPLLLAVNVMFCIFWLFVKWKYLVIPLAVILIRVDYIPRLIGMSSQDTVSENALRIMTYNVKGFGEGTETDKDRRLTNTDSILAIVKRINPDIVCLQEYASAKKDKNSFHYRMVDQLGYKYFFAPVNSKTYIRGSAIYSKHEIVKAACPFPMKKEYYSFSFADIAKGGKTLRVYNVHLASYMISDQEKEELNAVSKGRMTTEQTSKSVLSKLMSANQKRAGQVRELASILEQTEEDFLIVGDFNATPYSHTYDIISKYASDSFTKCGRGLSGTYNGPLPAFRIDYIFAGKNINVESYNHYKCDFSDHIPVYSDFKIPQN